MNILMVTPELSPVQKQGGLADGVAGLARALCNIGHRVVVALPFCRTEAPQGFRTAPPLTLPSPVGAPIAVERFEGTLVPNLDVVLLRPPGPLDRRVYGVEGDPVDGVRFALFCRAVVALLDERSFDVVHAHEWPTAPVTYLLRARGRGRPRTVLTLHNAAFRGMMPASSLPWLGIDTAQARAERIEMGGRIDFLRAGVLASDSITTVSPTHARELLIPPYGEGLEDLLRARSSDLLGIVNGLDTERWNPARDPALPARFDVSAPEGKSLCKEALVRALGLQPALPLLVSLGRLVEQKGVDLVAEGLPELVDSGASLVIAGEGELAAVVRKAVAQKPAHAVFLGAIDDAGAQRLLAAADLVLMPSRYEPCGIVQLEAQRYGAIPIAHRTGGLADTILDASPDLAAGNGFLFEPCTAAELLAAAHRSLQALHHPGFADLRRRALRAPRSWLTAARAYEAVYRGRSSTTAEGGRRDSFARGRGPQPG